MLLVCLLTVKAFSCLIIKMNKNLSEACATYKWRKKKNLFWLCGSSRLRSEQAVSWKWSQLTAHHAVSGLAYWSCTILRCRLIELAENYSKQVVSFSACQGEAWHVLILTIILKCFDCLASCTLMTLSCGIFNVRYVIFFRFLDWLGITHYAINSIISGCQVVKLNISHRCWNVLRDMIISTGLYLPDMNALSAPFNKSQYANKVYFLY